MPGLEEWLLMNREMEAIKSVTEIPLKNTNLFNKHLFPPSMESKEKLNLKRWYVMSYFVTNHSKLRPPLTMSPEKKTRNISSLNYINVTNKQKHLNNILILQFFTLLYIYLIFYHCVLDVQIYNNLLAYS